MRLSVWLTFAICCTPNCDGLGSREERQVLYPPPIVYPFGGTFKLIVGFAVPVQLSGRILVYGQNFQFQYAMPQNATFFTDFFRDAPSSRRRRSGPTDERSILYKLLEQEYQRKGLNGRDCLMRSICEAAVAPIQDEGLVGELLHILLTPDHGGNTSVHPDYLKAMEAGREYGDCSRIYSSCPPGQDILGRISRVT